MAVCIVGHVVSESNMAVVLNVCSPTSDGLRPDVGLNPIGPRGQPCSAKRLTTNRPICPHESVERMQCGARYRV